MRTTSIALAWLCACLVVVAAAEAEPTSAESIYAPWNHGPSADPDFFPVAVWLQAPSNAWRYQQAGFNVYVGLWQGPTETQLAQLAAVGMKTICSQNSVGLAHINDPTIIGWMQPDEPDNAQPTGSGGYYSPLPPFDNTWWNTNPSYVKSINRRYTDMQAADPSRPVMLNLGQGVAWDEWTGRGVRTNHPEDYPEYIQGGDIISFDIYPGASSHQEVKDKFWMVADGVDRLVSWSQPSQPVWNWIECTDIGGHGAATPAEVKAEVWMSLIHGSVGIGYFVHKISPDFDETGLLNDPTMLAAVTQINWRIQALAPVLNSPTIEGELHLSSSSPVVPIDSMVKKYDNATYIFAVAMRNGAATGTFYDTSLPPIARVEVLDEGRSFDVYGGFFTDSFAPFGVHLYKITSRIPGDATGDSAVNIEDFIVLKNNFGLASGAQWSQGDFNDDGAVTIDDFVILKNNFGFAAP